MKIGFFVDVFYPMVDGVVNVVDQYAKILSNNHEVYVFAPKPGDKTYKDDFPYTVKRVLKIQIPNTDYHLAIPPLDVKMNKYLSHLKLDIVHIHSPFSMGELGVMYAKKHQIPLFATLHSQYKKDFELRLKLTPITNLMLKDIIKRLNKCDQTFTVNSTILDVYMSYGLKKEPQIIPNATDMTYFMGETHMHEMKETYSISSHVFNMLFVGRIDKIKNITFIFDALKHLKKMTHDFHLYIVGKGPDLGFFKNYVKEHDLVDVVTFTGPIYDRKKLAAMYGLSDIFVFPSLYDTNSLVQLEAASQKTPTIFIKGAATAHHIKNNDNGYLEANDPEMFATRLAKIKNHLDLNQNIGENAYQTIYHTWEHSVNQLIMYYDKAVREKNE